MKLVLVAAMARDGAIGRDGGMPWHLPADLAQFKRVTQGHPVVMGRKTWDSLPPRFKPLPGRRNVVVTRQADWQAPGAERAGSLDEALRTLVGAAQVCVIGGGELYAQALPRADVLLLTEIDTTVPDADTHFPAWDREAFQEASRNGQTEGGLRFDWVRYERHAR